MNLKRFMINKRRVSVILISLCYIVNAQLEVTPIVDIEEDIPGLMLENLFGCNVNVTNIEYSGNLEAIGEFNYLQNDNLCENYFGMNRGLLMTTGHIDHALGPNNDGDSGEEWNTEYNDEFLHDYLLDFELITPSINLYDACVLEFNISSSGFTSIDFDIIFGSDEYTEWMSPYYSDAFCFFVSEIDGDIDPFFDSTPQNIMELADAVNFETLDVDDCDIENAPISTWTIRPYSYVFQMSSTNECLYLDNQNGNFCDAIGYDGYTIPMTFNLSLVPQATYQVKMVIVDAVSGSWAGLDSGVFIKNSGLSTSTALDFNWSDPVYDNSGATVSFTPNYIDADNIYFWDFTNDGEIDSNEIEPVFLFDEPGSYMVTLQVYNECTDSFESVSEQLIINEISTGLGDVSNNIVSIFPNPVDQFLTISLEDLYMGTTIEIVDLSGRILYNYISNDRSVHFIDVSDMIHGIYYLRITHPDYNNSYYKKIMIL